MRGVVMSVKGRYAVLLTQGGEFKKIRNKGYSIGDKIRLQSVVPRITTIAAALAVFAIGGGALSYYMPASYVSVDINPSMIMTLNLYDTVINVDPLNSDAEKLLENTDIKGLNINDGMELIIERSEDLGYLDKNGGEVVVSVVPSLKTPRVTDTDASDGVSFRIERGGKSDLAEAEELGVSVSKARAIKEYTETNGGTVSANAAKLRDMTLREIKEETGANKEVKAEVKASPAPKAEPKTRETGVSGVPAGEAAPSRAVAERAVPAAVNANIAAPSGEASAKNTPAVWNMTAAPVIEEQAEAIKTELLKNSPAPQIEPDKNDEIKAEAKSDIPASPEKPEISGESGTKRDIDEKTPQQTGGGATRDTETVTFPDDEKHDKIDKIEDLKSDKFDIDDDDDDDDDDDGYDDDEIGEKKSGKEPPAESGGVNAGSEADRPASDREQPGNGSPQDSKSSGGAPSGEASGGRDSAPSGTSRGGDPGGARNGGDAPR